jgi:ribonuclease BN (tRNA processing enzyme)
VIATIIGSGAAAPSPTRVQAGVHVATGAVRLLVDCGAGVVYRMAALGLDWSGITHVAITHFHADHLSDLVTLFVAWRYGQLPPRSAPLTLIGPPGTLEVLGRLATAFAVDVTGYGFPVTVIEMPRRGALPLGGGITLATHPVPHTPESVAYSVSDGAARLVISGDTSEDEAFADWAAGCDALLLECSLPESMAVPSHLTPEGVGRMAARARPGRLVCTHLYPPLEGADIAGAVARWWHGPVTVAHDGLVFALQGND